MGSVVDVTQGRSVIPSLTIKRKALTVALSGIATNSTTYSMPVSICLEADTRTWLDAVCIGPQFGVLSEWRKHEDPAITRNQLLVCNPAIDYRIRFERPLDTVFAPLGTYETWNVEVGKTDLSPK
jgi:hypothetical protein